MIIPVYHKALSKSRKTFFPLTIQRYHRIRVVEKMNLQVEITNNFVSKVVVTIRGLKATEEGKPASVKVSFSVKKTGKASKYSYVSKVNVLDEKLTMTAEATGVQQITATFNKAITDASKVKATVKKGSADRACTATVDGTKLVLAMNAKLVAGTYTVTVEGVADEALTATVDVAKNETLTSYKISPYATMARELDNSAATNSAIVVYEALNQYGEKMTAPNPTPSCTLGTITIGRAATANAAGELQITGMQGLIAVQGQKGTVILVGDNGITANQEVTVAAAATPATVDIAGVYNANTNKIEELKDGDKLTNYSILFTAKDQYDNDYLCTSRNLAVFNRFAKVNIAGGLTNVAVKNADIPITSRTVDGKEYFAIQLASATAVAGTYNLTIVNTEKGMLLNENYTVAESTIIKSASVVAEQGIYANKGTYELAYEFVDANGNTVTSYSVLKDLVSISSADNGRYGTIRFVKNADGSAKLLYELSGTQATDLNTYINKQTDADHDKESATVSFTLYANDQRTSNYIVKPLIFTAYEAKAVKSVCKLKDGTATSMAVSGTSLTISLDKIVYADQYGNEMSAGAAGMDTFTNVVRGTATSSQTSYVFERNAGGGIIPSAGSNAFVFTASGAKASDYAVVYLKYGETASANNYDFKFTVTAADTTGIDASTLKIDSIFGGQTQYYTQSGTSNVTATVGVGNIKVVGKIAGVDTEIPTSQYVIKSTKDMTLTNDEITKGTKTKTATVTIQVTTQDANGNRTETELTGTFKFSVDGRAIAKVDGVQSANTPHTMSDNGVVSSGALKALFNYKDQYDTSITYVDEDTAGSGNVLVAVDVYRLPSGASADTCKIIGSGTKTPSVILAQPQSGSVDYTLSVKAYTVDADGKETSAKDCKVAVTVTSTTTTVTILD